MTENEKIFISLLSSHLNNTIPEPIQDIEWAKVFKLSDLQNLTAIVALEMKKLPKESLPNEKGQSYFRQVLGLTIQNTQLKFDAIERMTSILKDAGIKHTIIKGGAIRHLYPVPEVRTSGDTDVVIDFNDKDKIKTVLLDNDFTLTSESVNQLVFTYLEQEFQFKTYFDCLNKEDRTVFSLDICESDNGYTYYLKPDYHFVYVLNHLLKHVKSGGVGFRQLMDVDIILRKQNIDLENVFAIFKEMNLEKSAKVIISLSKQLFNTPVEINFKAENDVYDKLIDIMINGGVFGYGIANKGTVKLAKEGSKSKALISTIFASKEYMYNTYMYANKHHWLLPFAYLHRLFDAVFKRGKSNLNSIKSILSDDENATKLADIQKELEI